jgi:RHS repeat-associated protein
VNDADTGLVYMQQRYYDPIAGRFLSQDPVTTDAATGSAFNRYAYAQNNPYRYTDPDGREPGDAAKQTYASEGWTTVYQAGSSSGGGGGRSGANTVQGQVSGIAHAFATNGKLDGERNSTELAAMVLGLAIPGGEAVAAAKGAANFLRELQAADLGIEGAVQELRGTFAVKDGVATMRVDMIRGQVQNPLQVVGNMAEAAKASGATSLRIEGTIANERLYNVLQQRYGLTSSGAVDSIRIPLR